MCVWGGGGGYPPGHGEPSNPRGGSDPGGSGLLRRHLLRAGGPELGESQAALGGGVQHDAEQAQQGGGLACPRGSLSRKAAILVVENSFRGEPFSKKGTCKGWRGWMGVGGWHWCV